MADLRGSLVVADVDAMGGLVGVKSGIRELTSKESLGELRRAREILGRDILDSGFVSVLHRRSLEQGISDLEGMGGVDDFVALVGETFGREHL